MIFIRNKDVYIGKSSIEGYGVFAGSKINNNDIIQECPFIVVNKSYEPVSDVVFTLNRASNINEFPHMENKNGLVLGIGSMFNTALKPEGMSAEWVIRPELNCVEYFATRDIEAGEEILLFYGSDWLERRKVDKNFI